MKVAVVGATGIVGEKILRVLEERNLPVEQVGAFASRDRKDAAAFRGRPLDVRAVSARALRAYDVVFFASSEDASKRYAPELLERGKVVLDNSSAYRLKDGVPLVVPEVNAHAIAGSGRLFPIGNCTAIILCMALAPIRDTAGLRFVNLSTYQAVSGAGRATLEEFDRGEGPIVGNVVPHVGLFDGSGSTGEEEKVAAETRKVLELPALEIAVTAVRVPVRTAHCEAIFVRTARATKVSELAAAFERTPGVIFHRAGIVTPREVEGTDLVHVARLRGHADAFMLWAVGDQLRKGAATNGVQILEELLRRGAVR